MTNTATVEVNHAEQNAKGWYSTIDEQVERLAHTGDCSCDWDDYQEDADNCDVEIKFDTEEEFDDYHNEDKAREAIEEGPLSVQVRSAWVTPGEEMVAEDFEILLTTGGPALRIMGELDEYKQPCRAWLEYQDWGTPWTQLFGPDQGTLVSYSSNFYFGE